MTLFDWLIDPRPVLLMSADDDSGEGGGEPAGETVDVVDQLASEGEELPPEGEEASSEGEEEDPALAALRDEIAELKAERTFLRGEVAKKPAVVQAPTPAPRQTDPVEAIVAGLDMDVLAARITDKDPKVGIKAVVDIAKEVAKAMVAEGLKDARGYTDASQVERAQKETDIATTMSEFGDDMERYGQPFMDALQTNLNDITEAAGGRYIRGAMAKAAAITKVAFDRRAAAQRNTIRGVTRVRPQGAPASQTNVSDADSYANIKTIQGIPDNLMSARDKAAARRVAQQMGVKESEWVANYFAERADNDRFGV